MRYSRRQRKIRRRAWGIGIALAVLVVAGGWYYWPDNDPPPAEPTGAETAALLVEQRPAPTPPTARQPAAPPRATELVAHEEVIIPAETSEPQPHEAEFRAAFHFQNADPEPQQATGAAPTPPGDDPTAARVSNDTRTGNQQIEAARKQLEAGRVIEARHQLNALLNRNLTDIEASEVRALLTRIADDTVFSKRTTPNDPVVTTYVIQPGDLLINIGRQFHVPHETLMQINRISDATRIRADQLLKVPRGPFHAKIVKSDFRLDVYLGDLYVRSYRVGLGAGGRTPEGEWLVKERLPNPTYYPPASAEDKRIIPPNDPENPLGEHWIGLKGVSGDAVGHDGYGIHGTIEPESIGRAVSLGCVRMHNEDVAELYKLMLPGESRVTITP